MKLFGFVLKLGLVFAMLQARGQVVINEIFYHAPDDISDLQWVELYNTSNQPVSLSGWRLSKAVKFEFGPEATIQPRGYLVVCKNKQRFEEFYKMPVAGEFSRTFKHNGERLELRNPTGHTVDTVEFGNRPPWPHGPDGRTASLERICPTCPGNLPENWAGSPLSDDATQPGGTPGGKNAAYCASLPPVISQVAFPSNCIAPGQPIRIEANVKSKVELKKVELLYRLIQSGSVGEEKSIEMSKSSLDGGYEGSVPGQQAGQVVRVRLRAVDQNQAERIYPSPTEVRPALSFLVFTNGITGRIPFGYIIHPDAAEAQSALRQVRGGGGAQSTPEGQGRFMVQMVFRNALDLPQLWAALTLTNCAAADLEKLRPVFRQQEHECDLLEEKTIASLGLEEIGRKVPELIKPFKDQLAESLKPLLNPEQDKAFESWRAAPSAGMGNPMGDPAAMLRQFVRLEPDFFHLATSTNVTAAQMTKLCELYRDAIQQRDALLPEVRKLMSNQGQQNREEGDKLQARAMAIPAETDKKLKQTLTSSQNRQLLAWKAADQPAFMRHSRTRVPEPVLGDSAFVFVDPATKQPKLFDFVRIPERSGGWKVHFGKDQEWNGMSVADIIFEASERWVLAEPLAYELYHRAGVAACRTDFIRLIVDGQPAGYYLLIEQVNKAFLRQNGVRDDGNLYKANWTGDGLVGQHDKHINRRTGHDDLVRLVEQLEKTKSKPDEQWALIRREFDVDQVLTHYAVRMLISDWDGFFNNYWLYHDVNGTGKWTFYPWDEDKTWGEYDGWEQAVLYNLPLTYGAEGDHPPGETGGRPSQSYGFGQWWRAGGYISRPLLSNPTFRKLFLARVKDLLNKEFTQERLFPVVDGFRDQLQDEVNYRAQVRKEEPVRAQKQFEANLASLKEFITKRRQWLLEQEEIRAAGPYERDQLK